MTDTVNKLPKTWEWHNKRISGNANGHHCCSSDLVGKSILRRRGLKIFYQQYRPIAVIRRLIDLHNGGLTPRLRYQSL